MRWKIKWMIPHGGCSLKFTAFSGNMRTSLQALLCFPLSDADIVHCSLSTDLGVPRAAPQNTRHIALRSHTAAANQASQITEEASDVFANRFHVNTVARGQNQMNNS